MLVFVAVCSHILEMSCFVLLLCNCALLFTCVIGRPILKRLKTFVALDVELAVMGSALKERILPMLTACKISFLCLWGPASWMGIFCTYA